MENLIKKYKLETALKEEDVINNKLKGSVDVIMNNILDNNIYNIYTIYTPDSLKNLEVFHKKFKKIIKNK